MAACFLKSAMGVVNGDGLTLRDGVEVRKKSFSKPKGKFERLFG